VIVEEPDDKARVRFDDGSERTLLRRFLSPESSAIDSAPGAPAPGPSTTAT
jgi:hypothetical protein